MAKAVRWDLIADPRKFQRGFREAERSVDRFHRNVTRVAGLIGTAFAGVQVAGFLKGAIDEAREAQRVGRQTAAVIKATGGVAKVSARDVDRLATALSNKVGVDDELIASGENLLLTFKGIRNEAGKGNDVFDQASAAIVDMTAAMNNGDVTAQGLKASTIQVGKALNDPIKGMTALTRVGVTFNDAQRKQIKTLVESGRTMEAQKVILGELKSEFGGAAAAAADPWKRFGVIMANIKERIGTALLPALDAVANFMGDRLPKVIDALAAGPIGRFVHQLGVARDILGVLGPKAALKSVFPPEMAPAIDKIATAVGKLVSGFREGLGPQLDRIKKAWDDNKASLGELLGTITTSTDTFNSGRDAAKTFGDALVAATEAAGKIARGMKAAGDILNEADRRFQAAGKDIHNEFVVPVTRDILRVALVIVQSWHKTLQVTATVAEALHLPMAKGLRKAEQVVGRAIGSIQGTIDKLHGKDVTVTAHAKATIAKQTVDWLRASHVKIPQLNAEGGPIRGPGTGTSDSIPAYLSNGEYVVNARSAAKHRAALDFINADRYAVGGQVGRLQKVVDASGLALKRGSQHAIDVLAGSLGRALGKAINQAVAGGIGGLAAIKRFILSTDRLPYRWGAAGPSAYDCSGLVSAVYGLVSRRGGGHGQRYFTTATFPGSAPFHPGAGGIFQVGVRRGGPHGTGHMVGRYGGLGFEARSTATGIFVGRAARSPGSVGRVWHLAQGGPVSELAARLARVPGVDVAGDPASLNVVAGRFTGLASGGIVRRPTLAMIGERGPEAVVPLTGARGRPGPVVVVLEIDGRAFAEATIPHLEHARVRLKRR